MLGVCLSPSLVQNVKKQTWPTSSHIQVKASNKNEQIKNCNLGKSEFSVGMLVISIELLGINLERKSQMELHHLVEEETKNVIDNESTLTPSIC